MIPAAGSRSSVCMYTPARKSFRRRPTFLRGGLAVVGRPALPVPHPLAEQHRPVEDEHGEHGVEDELPHARDVLEDRALHGAVVMPLG